MNICFVMPKFSRRINGGFKIAYEYANRLLYRGYSVSILFINESSFKDYRIPKLFKIIGANYLTQKEPTWFDLDPSILKISGFDKKLKEKTENIDVYIATSIGTVEYTNQLNKDAKKAYFIQDYEIWDNSKEYVHNTYKLGMKNIVISNWLENIVNQYACEPCTVIKNPVDTKKYTPICPLANRYKHSISFLYHKDEHKGTKYVLEAVNRLKGMYPDLKAYAFGAAKRGVDMPDFVEYTYCASQEQTIEIYNKTTMFLCGTVQEGYGLTGLEAMACGTVLVSTAYQSVFEYAEDDKNALLSPIKNVNRLVENAIKVFEVEGLKERISLAALESVNQGFTWDGAVDKFEKILKTI